MKKIILLCAVLILAITIFSGCSSSAEYVDRAMEYIEEKYDMEVELQLVRGDENGYSSAGYYYTHFSLIDEPTFEFRVAEALEDDTYTGTKKGEIADNYDLIVIANKIQK